MDHPTRLSQDIVNGCFYFALIFCKRFLILSSCFGASFPITDLRKQEVAEGLDRPIGVVPTWLTEPIQKTSDAGIE
ncbi:hypothetical protein [Saccharococcus thermophilus]|uniref:hypothetical protein n=1 Tax=Saccharococcus thermophilus TaxID=29396 RepID=UPI0036D34A9C